jgi:hypothetical protein
VFALARSLDQANAAGQAMAAAWAAASGVPADLWVSPVGTSGARVITAEAAR